MSLTEEDSFSVLYRLDCMCTVQLALAAEK